MTFRLPGFLHSVANFFVNAITNAPPEAHDLLNSAAAQATQAAQAVEAVVPLLVKGVADAALAQVPGFNAYVPEFNAFLDALAAELLSRKTPPKA